MLNIFGGQLHSHWVGLNDGYKWACKAIEFYQNENERCVKYTENWISLGFDIFRCLTFSYNFWGNFRVVTFFNIALFVGWIFTLGANWWYVVWLPEIVNIFDGPFHGHIWVLMYVDNLLHIIFEPSNLLTGDHEVFMFHPLHQLIGPWEIWQKCLKCNF